MSLIPTFWIHGIIASLKTYYSIVAILSLHSGKYYIMVQNKLLPVYYLSNIDIKSRPLKIKNWDTLIQKLQKNVFNYITIDNKYINSVTDLNYNHISSYGEIKAIINVLNLTQHVSKYVIHISTGAAESHIHVDMGDDYLYSLNIPISNCQDTYIDIYETIEVAEPVMYSQSSTVSFPIYNEDVCVFKGRFSTSTPYILNTQIPHKVIPNNNSNKRIMLLIRLKPSFDINSLIL